MDPHSPDSDSSLGPQPTGIRIRREGGRCYTVKVWLRDVTVRDLKAIVQDHEGIPPDEVELVMGIVQLDDRRPLFDYGMVEGSIVDRVYRMAFDDLLRLWALTVHVNMGESRVASLLVQGTETVASFKAKIQSRIGLPSDRFWLHSDCLQLDEGADRTLAECQVKDDAIVYIVMRLTDQSAPAAQRIFVKLPNGRTLSLPISPSDTVASLKVAVCSLEGFRPEVQTLAMGLRRLEDAATLAECRIHGDAELMLIVDFEG